MRPSDNQNLGKRNGEKQPKGMTQHNNKIVKSMQDMSEVPHLINALLVEYSDEHIVYLNVIMPSRLWANLKERVSTYAIYNNNWGH